MSNVLKTFNGQFGTLFTDADRVAKRIRDDIAPKVAADAAYQNAKENTPHTARIAHDQALAKVMQHLLKDDTQVYKQFVENESFRRWVTDTVFGLTYEPSKALPGDEGRTETFESLWNYCASNRRAIPKDWHKLFEMLANKHQDASGTWTPPLPPILGAWYLTIPIEKHLHFEQHIRWAHDQHQLEEIGGYLRSLREDEWYHFGEL